MLATDKTLYEKNITDRNVKKKELKIFYRHCHEKINIYVSTCAHAVKKMLFYIHYNELLCTEREHKNHVLLILFSVLSINSFPAAT
jgi:hypothetical protein